MIVRNKKWLMSDIIHSDHDVASGTFVFFFMEMTSSLEIYIF